MAAGRRLCALQLVFLLALFVVVFLAPITSDQLTDVLRAGDGPADRPLAGLGAALLLGAARPGQRRPAAGAAGVDHPRAAASPAPASPSRWRRGVAGVVLWVLAGVEAAATACLAVALLAALTTPAPRTAAGEDEETLRRLAATLGVVPVAILLAGLAAAATDSLLLPSPAVGLGRRPAGLDGARRPGPRPAGGARPGGGGLTQAPSPRAIVVAGTPAGAAGIVAALAVLATPLAAALGLLALGAVLAWRPADEAAPPSCGAGPAPPWAPASPSSRTRSRPPTRWAPSASPSSA